MKINLRYTLLICCIITIFLSACKKDSETAVVTLKVMDPNNLPAGGIEFDILITTENGSIRYDSPISNPNGEIKLNLTKGKPYLIDLLSKEAYDDWYMGNTEAILFPRGTFKSLEEIDKSARQNPTPTIGDIRYQDFNGDGIINIDDLVLKLEVKENQQITINLIAGRKAFYKN